MELVKILVISLFLTLFIEVVLALVLGIRKRQEIMLVALVNIVTNPVVVFCYSILGYVISNHMISWNPILRNPWMIKIILEIFAVLCEAFYYKRYSKTIKHPFWLSLFLNGASFGIGCFID